MKRRLLVARALMNKPKLAILDEPTGGSDVLQSDRSLGSQMQEALLTLCLWG